MSLSVETIRNAVIGANHAITTPFGTKPMIYADYTASGRSLQMIENYIQQQVLPWYANTHTETSASGAISTRLREQAREEVRKALNAGNDDCVIFCGTGATAAINRLVDALGLRLPTDAALRKQVLSSIAPESRPVVFIGPYEHHSNELPWRESLAEVVAIPLDEEGQIDQAALAEALQRYNTRPLRVGSFSAASNVTGILSDVEGVSRLLHQHGALACWDYAAAGPYVNIDMNGPEPLDAVFVSPHKFIGGPGTPGLLVAKSQLLSYEVPAMSGGGTVAWVSPWGHRYVEDRERREEGGTPGIVEAIRAGLVFKLRGEVGMETITRREHSYVERAMTRLGSNPNIEIVGSKDAPRLAILSMRFRHNEQELHHGFVVALLNDLFGIQARAGCSCAGPYGHHLLGMDRVYSEALDEQLAKGNMILRPGWVRLGFNYFIDEAEFDYLLNAIELVAEHGWRLLSNYRYCFERNVWVCGEGHHQGPSLCDWAFAEAQPDTSGTGSAPSLDDTLVQAGEVFINCTCTAPAEVQLPPDAEAMRWFMLPQEAAALLTQER